MEGCCSEEVPRRSQSPPSALLMIITMTLVWLLLPMLVRISSCRSGTILSTDDRPSVLQPERAMAFWRLRGATEEEQRLPLDPHLVQRGSCSSFTFLQRVQVPGCDPVLVPNRMCFGRCSSFHVPGAGGEPRAGCSACIPRHVRSAPVRPRCTSHVRPPAIHLTLVHACTCEALPSRQIHARTTRGDEGFEKAPFIAENV
uniref:CTCK domain-containing protein n=2 Tax=Eptatretus burgeri TaxID=7764 RepID=A0A8C4QHL8_EPTBU